MSVTADAVLVILQSRYDYHSARAVLSSAASAAGLDAKGPFDPKALGALADAIRGADDSAATTAEVLRGAAGAAKPAAPKAAPKAKEPAAKAKAGKAKPKAAKAKAKAAKPKS